MNLCGSNPCLTCNSFVPFFTWTECPFPFFYCIFGEDSSSPGFLRPPAGLMVCWEDSVLSIRLSPSSQGLQQKDTEQSQQGEQCVPRSPEKTRHQFPRSTPGSHCGALRSSSKEFNDTRDESSTREAYYRLSVRGALTRWGEPLKPRWPGASRVSDATCLQRWGVASAASQGAVATC